ncbi:MAG: fumarylacetoacetate hydrolase family protein [Gammaproteobacteria bacterium]|nr:fumarylacetoacetate hydrolase family protein [Gammaproteobacteria bacterium]
MLAPLPIGKMVCVGRNYGAHAAELGNAIPEQPLLFMKPASAWQPLYGFVDGKDAERQRRTNIVHIPQGLGSCHHELELTLLIGEHLSSDSISAQAATANVALKAIAGVGLGLDLTLRDLQEQLKRQGQPWERAKAFAGSAPLTEFIAVEDLGVNLDELSFTLHRNGSLQQHGKVSDMIFPIAQLVLDIATTFSLQPGDIIFTGTPAGVSALHAGDELVLALQAGEQEFTWQAHVADATANAANTTANATATTNAQGQRQGE